MNQVFLKKFQSKIPKLIADMLHEEYKNYGSVRKTISKIIGANPRTVKNWYEGNNTPNLLHFMALAEKSPMLTNWFLKSCGYDYVIPNQQKESNAINAENISVNSNFYSFINDTIKIKENIHIFKKLNKRQIWFYFQLQENKRLAIYDIMDLWDVSYSTARRDIAGLINLSLIYYVGSRKNGYYVKYTNI